MTQVFFCRLVNFEVLFNSKYHLIIECMYFIKRIIQNNIGIAFPNLHFISAESRNNDTKSAPSDFGTSKRFSPVFLILAKSAGINYLSYILQRERNSFLKRNVLVVYLFLGKIWFVKENCVASLRVILFTCVSSSFRLYDSLLSVSKVLW